MHVTRLFCPPLKWEKGVGGMRGKGARECRTLLISPKNSTLARTQEACSSITQTAIASDQPGAHHRDAPVLVG